MFYIIVGAFQPVTTVYNVNEDQETVHVCFTSDSGASREFRLVTRDSSATSELVCLPSLDYCCHYLCSV